MRDGLFSEDQEGLTWALRMVDAWSFRAKVPAAVDSTANLKLLLSQKHGPVRIFQLALSSALVRLVNEAVDPFQQGTYALPISHLAERIKLPRLLVDIRHECTHDSLPAIDVLVYGAELAIEWLKSSYWLPLSNYEQEIQRICVASVEKLLEAAKQEPISPSSGEKKLPNVARFLNEVPHLETSAEVQRFFMRVSGDALKFDRPLLIATITHLAEKSVLLPIVFVDYLLSLQEHGSLQKLMLEVFTEIILPRIETFRILTSCMRSCLVAVFNSNETAIKTLQQLAGLQLNLNTEQAAFVQVFAETRAAGNNLAKLKNEAIRLISLLETMPQAETEDQGNWAIHPNWRPRPLGLLCMQTMLRSHS